MADVRPPFAKLCSVYRYTFDHWDEILREAGDTPVNTRSDDEDDEGVEMSKRSSSFIYSWAY